MFTFLYNSFFHLNCRLAVAGWASSCLHRQGVFESILEDDISVIFFLSSLRSVKTPKRFCRSDATTAGTPHLLKVPQNPLKSSQRQSAALTNAISHVQQHVLCIFVLLRLYYTTNYQFNGTILTFPITVHCYLLLVAVRKQKKNAEWEVTHSDLCTFTVGRMQILCNL